MPRRFAHPLIALFAFLFSLVVPVFLAASPAAAGTAATAPHGVPQWMPVAGLVFFLGSLAVTVWLLVQRRRDPDLSTRGDPWHGWNHADGKDAYEAATDPSLTAIPSTTAVMGTVVPEDDWTAAMSIPAPAIQAYPVAPEVAERWISAHELDRRVTDTIARADALFQAGQE